jgi:hypothetical protein
MDRILGNFIMYFMWLMFYAGIYTVEHPEYGHRSDQIM